MSSRSVAVVVVMALALSLLPVVSATAEVASESPASTEPTADSAEASELVRDDVVTAQIVARQTGRRVLVASQTTQDSLTYANPNGSFTADVAAGPVRVFDEDAGGEGQWRDVDTTLGLTDGEVRARNVPADVAFAAQGDTLVHLQDGEREIDLSWSGVRLPAPDLNGSVARYRDVAPGVDLELEALVTGFAKRIIVKQRPTKPVVWRLPLKLRGLTATRKSTGGLELRDGRGRLVASSDSAWMWGAERDPRADEPTRVAEVTTRLVDTKQGQVLEVEPDFAFLSDPSVTYPVTVDPSTTLTATGDTFVQSNISNTSQWNSTELKIGTYDGGSTKARSYVRFNVSSFSGKDVEDARLWLRNFHSYSCSKREVLVRRLVEGFSSSTVWSTAPSGTSSGEARSSFAYGYSSSCSTQTASIPVPHIAQAWANGVANHGMLIRATDETDSYGWKKFRSTDAGSYEPRLYVTYNSYPHIPSSPAPATGSKHKTLTPALSGVFKDADGGKGRLQFEVYDHATGGLVASSGLNASLVASGSRSAWTVPSGKLATNRKYRWRARAHDGSLYSKQWTNETSTGWVYFTTDATKPPTPTISSSSHPDQNQWYPDGAISASWTAVSDYSGIAGYRAVMDQSSTTTITSGTTSTALDLPPTTKGDGVHWLHVAALDGAGNWSSTAHYRFRIGEPTVTTPLEGDTTQKWLELAASGNGDHTGVTFQYRRTPTATWATVPATTVQREDGSAITWPVAMSGGDHAPLIWNVPATSATFGDGEVWLRAQFAGATGGATEPVRFMLNRAASPDGHKATADVGPGVVNLLTGNYTVMESDVAQSTWAADMTVARTFNSRNPDARDVAGQANAFGPGWTASFPALDGMDWASLQAGADLVTVNTGDGDEVYFFQTAAGYAAEEGYEDLTLIADSTGFVLEDLEGTTIRFQDPSSTGVYRPTSVTQTGADSGLRYIWTPSLPRRLQAIVTDKVGDTPCGNDAAQLQPGCRMLSLEYDAAGRAVSLAFTAFDPAQTAMTTMTMVRYSYGTDGRLTSVTDQLTGLQTSYTYDTAGRLTSITPPGVTPWRLEYKGGSALDAGRLVAVARTHPSGDDARTTVRYDLAVSGTGAPYQLGRSDVAVWGQQDFPVDAGAILPPGASDLSQATVVYMNRDGRRVNIAAPGERILVTEYDELGNVVRDLLPENRRRALNDPDPATAAMELSTLRTYDASGLRLLEELGPRRQIAYRNSEGDQLDWGRTVTTRVYDEGAPTSGGPYHLPTTTTTFGRLDDGTHIDPRTTKIEYDWTHRQPTRTITDPGGLNLVRGTLYNAQGQEIERRQPSEPNGGGPGTLRTRYYTAGNHPDGDLQCDYKPEWVNLACKTLPAAQPTGNGRPGLPITHTTYDKWLQPEIVTDAVTRADGTTATRTSTTEYDSAGRVRYQSLTGGDGEAVPTIRTDYDTNTGAIVATRTVDRNGAGDTVLTSTTRSYDVLGRQVAYTDAGDGSEGSRNTSTITYDLLDRPSTLDDGQGVRTVTYSATTGLVSHVVDSDAGTFTAEEYDHDGNVVRQRLPGDIIATTTVDEIGVASRLTYTRGSDCATSSAGDPCQLLEFSLTTDAHGNLRSDDSDVRSRRYSYDAAGRLASADDVSATSGCETRNYTLDANSNRTAKRVRTFALSGSDCAPTATTDTTQAHTYDAADRMTDAGYTYDAFGRTLVVPSATAGGSDLAVSYSANDLVRSLSQGGVAQTFTRDPQHRVRTKAITGQPGHERYAYSDDSDAPAWTQAGATVNRYVAGLADGLTATSTGTVVNDVQHHRLDLQLGDLGGNIAATVAVDDTRWTQAQRDESAGTVTVTGQNDEFGAPTPGSDLQRYGWLGAHKRETALATGVMLMGARVYNSVTGRFLSVDPVQGGSASDYDYANHDPVNQVDVTGRSSGFRRMNRRERILCAAFPLMCADVFGVWARWASRRAAEYAVTSAGTNAMRHCLWAASMTWAWGERNARMWLNAHEYGVPRNRDHFIDLANNEVGIKLGRGVGFTLRPKAVIFNRCKCAMREGRLTLY